MAANAARWPPRNSWVTAPVACRDEVASSLFISAAGGRRPNGAGRAMSGTDFGQTVDRHLGRPAHAG